MRMYDIIEKKKLGEELSDADADLAEQDPTEEYELPVEDLLAIPEDVLPEPTEEENAEEEAYFDEIYVEPDIEGDEAPVPECYADEDEEAIESESKQEDKEKQYNGYEE